MRSCVLAVAMVVLGGACGAHSVTTDVGTVEADPTEPDVAPLRVGCDNGPYFPLDALDSPPPLLEDGQLPDVAESLAEVAEALAPFLESEEGAFWPQEDWRVLEMVEREHVLVVHPGTPESPSLAFVSATWRTDGWRWSGASRPDNCVLVVEPTPDDGAVVDWEVDPAAEPLDPDTTTLSLLATERGCASGQAMGDRLHDPDVTLTDDAVLIRLTTEPRGGDQSCPSNPSQRVEIELGEPLGQRAVKDARTTDLGELADILQELIWGDAAEAGSDADETAEDAATVTTETQPEPDCDSDATSIRARDAVDALLSRLIDGAADGDLQPAADLWADYHAAPDAAGFLKTLVESHPWLLDGDVQTVVVDAFALPTTCPDKVVAVVDPNRTGTFAVLVDTDGTIQRIQGTYTPPEPPEFTSSGVILPTSPVEGFAVAYLESTRLSDDTITIDGHRTVISIPSRSGGSELLIVSMATPELPTAYSLVLD